jgi:hypothetical protein
MSRSEGGGGLGAVSFLSTHPANAKRIQVNPLDPRSCMLTVLQQLEEWLPDVGELQ